MSQREPIDLSPDKEIYRSAAVDVTFIDAIEELIDNAIDNWTRTSRRTDDVTVSIEADGSTTVIRDDTGGLKEEQIHLLFALGETFQTEVPNSIGAYGIGAKKAIVRLGETATVKSRSRDADVGVGFRVDEEWLESDDWTVEPMEFPELEEGVTEIAVESNEDIWDEERLDALENQLGKTYAKFIEGDMPQGGSVTLELNGDKIEPGHDIPWSFTPFDGHYPRRYEGIDLDHSSLSDTVTMNVTVGHMRKQKENLSGTDFYCQDRLVLESDTSETGGFGSSAENKIGNFTNQNNRLKVIVELKTEGDSSDLPWDGQKSDIDAYHPVTRMVHDWLRRIVKPYFKADAGKLRKPYVAPYSADSDVAANDGEVVTLDYSGRERMGSGEKHKPDPNLTRVKEVEEMVKEHAARGIKYTENLDPEEVPAYETRLAEEAEVDLEDLEVIEDFDELEDTEDEAKEETDKTEDFTHIDEVLQDINGAGESRRDNLYAAGFETVGDLRDASVDELTAVDGVGKRLAEAIKDAVSVETPDEPESEKESSAQETETDQTELDVESDEGATTPAETTSDQPAKVEGISTAEPNSSGVEWGERDGKVVLPVEFSEETYEKIRRKVGVPDDADVEDVAEVLATKLEAMYVTPEMTADD